jgi:Conserved region of Rad21 / Rec8 like protein
MGCICTSSTEHIGLVTQEWHFKVSLCFFLTSFCIPNLPCSIIQFIVIFLTITTHDNNKVLKIELDLDKALGGNSEHDEGDEGEHREAIGDNSTGTNWHRNTAAVWGVLQGKMPVTEKEEEKPTQLSFDILTQNSCRRTAASAFFEMLQLKTLDIIDLHQDEPYGDIAIMPGTRFNENKSNQYGKQHGR